MLVASADGTLQNNWNVTRNLVEEFLYAGIELTNATNSTVQYNVVNARVNNNPGVQTDPGDSGVGIEIATRDQAGVGVTSGTTLVDGNVITGALFERAGINLLSRAYIATSNAVLENVTVSNNTVSGSTGRGGIVVVAEKRNSAVNASFTNLIIDSNNQTIDANTTGLSIGHIAPEASVCGPIALVEEGDRIRIDIPNRRVDLMVGDSVFEERRKDWKPREPRYTTGALAKYAKLVSSASQGAVTG